jgi:CBS domain-containing protein
MDAKDLMTTDVLTVKPDSTLHEVATIIREKKINGVPVVDSLGILLGIITVTDLTNLLVRLFKKIDMDDPKHIEHLHNLFKEKKVRDYMTHKVKTLKEDSRPTDIMKFMFEDDIHTLPVIRDDKLVGVIGKHDLINVFF